MSTLFSVEVELKTNFHRFFYAWLCAKQFSHGISETGCRGSLPGANAPVSSMMAERHMPVRIKELLKINFHRSFYSSRRMAELFLQIYQISLVILVIF